jgi:hypothetical protein
MADSLGQGLLIGLLAAFGSAAIVGIILLIVYFFQYTSRGRIFLDNLSWPGEFDDEHAFLRDEAEALETMDDMQRIEYLRAKCKNSRMIQRLNSNFISICSSESTRISQYRHFSLSIPRHTRKGRISLGV